MSQEYKVVDSGHMPGTPENPLHKIATVPNFITFLRLVLTIIFLVMYINDSLRVASIIIFIIAASTDWLDGQVARRTRQVSVFGKRFDPIMDRILIFSGVLAMIVGGKVPLWIVAFLLIRDLYLFIGGIILKLLTGTIINVVYVGKAATFALMSGFAIVLLDLFQVPGLGLLETAALPGWGSSSASLGIWAIYLGIILSFLAAVAYSARGVRVIKTTRR